jgi:transposase
MAPHAAPRDRSSECHPMIVRHDDSPCRSMLQGGSESATTWLVFGETARAMTDVNDTPPNGVDALNALFDAARAMRDVSDIRPNDVAALLALLDAARADHAAAVAERDAVVNERDAIRAERDQLAARNEKLEAMIAEIRRAHFGRKSEKINDDQLALALEELETSLAKTEAEAEAEDKKTGKPANPRRRAKSRAKRFPNLDHLPHVVEVIEPESTACPCCGEAMHVIGEDVSKRLDVVPAQLRVIETHRPKYACRPCEKTSSDDGPGVVQAPAPARLIVGGLPTEALVAHVVVSKHADHLPLFRQAQIMARQGVEIERSTLAHWVGTAAAELQPLHDYLIANLKESPKLFCDETTCPVLDPGRGETKTGYMWVLARDDRPWGGSAPPAVAYTYAPGRGAIHAVNLLAGYSGILQVDGYTAYGQLTKPTREGGAVTLAFCWAHLRRRFYEIYVGSHAPIATEALARIGQLYQIEAEIRGQPPEVRKAVRQEKSKPIIEAMKLWFQVSLGKVSQTGKVAEAIRYGLNHWDGLLRFLDDGRIEIDSNTVERQMRTIKLDQKNSLFAGHDEGAKGWAMHASFFSTCKLNSVDPEAWLTDVLTKLVNLWPASRIGELMPWAYAPKPAECEAARDGPAVIRAPGIDPHVRAPSVPA